MKRFLILFMTLILLSSISYSASFDANVKGWQLKKHDGLQYEYFTTGKEFTNSTEKICLYTKTPMASNDPVVQSMNFYYKTGIGADLLILSPQNVERVQEQGKVTKICYDVKNKDIKHLQFGDNTTVWVYNDYSMVSYYDNVSDTHINITLLKNVSGNYIVQPDNIWISVNEDNYKFGANDSENTDLRNYRYLIESDKEIWSFQNRWFVGGDFYIKTGFFGNEYYTDDSSEIDFADICSESYSDCVFNSSNNKLIVDFVDDKFIDPYIDGDGNNFSSFNAYFFNNTNIASNSVQLINYSLTGTFSNVVEYKEKLYQAPTNGLVAAYFINVTQDNRLYDWSGNNHNLTQQNGTTPCNYPGVDGFMSSCRFDNVTWMSAPSTALLRSTSSNLSGYSICYFANPRSYQSDYAAIITSWTGSSLASQRSLLRNTNKQVNFQHNLANGTQIQTLSATNSVQQNTWTHICNVWSGTNTYNVVNGVVSGTVQTATTVSSGTSNMQIHLVAAYPNFMGDVDIQDLYIYNRTLSASEINQLYMMSPKSIYWHNMTWNFTNPNNQTNVTVRVRYSNVTNEVYNTSDLMAWYKLNENSTSSNGIIDYSIWSRNATMNGNNTFMNGSDCYPFGDGCWQFSGKNNTPLTANAPNTGRNTHGEFSAEVWFKQEGNGGGTDSSQALIGGNANFFFDYLQASRQLRVFANGLNNTNIQSTAVIFNLNEWNYAVFVFDNSSRRSSIYLNGANIYNISNNGSIIFGSSGFLIGAGLTSNPTRPFNGTIDSVRIYQRVLTDDEIKWNYYHTHPDNMTAWTNYYTNDTLSRLSGNRNVRYIQYETLLQTSNASVTPSLITILLNTNNYNLNTAPTINLTSPTNNSYINANYTLLIWNSSDADGDVLNHTIIVDGVTIAYTNETSYNVTGLADGLHNWTINVTDNTEITASDTYYFTIDTITPALTLTLPEIRTYNSYYIPLEWTVSDTNLDSCWYDYNGTNISVNCSINSTIFIIQPDIVYNVTFYVNDSAGNINSSNIYGFIYDDSGAYSGRNPSQSEVSTGQNVTEEIIIVEPSLFMKLLGYRKTSGWLSNKIISYNYCTDFEQKECKEFRILYFDVLILIIFFILCYITYRFFKWVIKDE